MPTTFRPVIIWNIIHFSACGYSQEMSRIINVSQDAISKVLSRIRETNSLTQGLRGLRMKTIISKEDRTLLRVMGGGGGGGGGGTMILSVSGIGAGMIRGTGHCVWVCTVQDV